MLRNRTKDLLQDRLTDEVIKIIGVSLLHKTSKFHVAMHPCIEQQASECDKNISDTLGNGLLCNVFLTTF